MRLLTHCNSVRLLERNIRATFKELHDLTYIVKNEYVLKLARNDIPKLTRTVLKFCYKKSSSLCLQLANTQENGRRYHVGPKVILQKTARTTNQQLTIFIKRHPYIHRVGQWTEMMRYFTKLDQNWAMNWKKRKHSKGGRSEKARVRTRKWINIHH